MKENEKFDIPFQVQTLISTLLDKKERVHIRGNYRQRLDAIRQACDKAILNYDTEMGTMKRPAMKKGK
jgi:hypothetical protein